MFLDLRSTRCRLGKQPGGGRERVREREGAGWKSGCGSHPSTPPKHPRAASSAVLQLHVWGSTPSFLPSFVSPKEARGQGQHGGGSSPSPSADNPCHRPSFGSEREVSDKSSLPSVEEEGKTEMNRGVSEEGERREVEK